MLKSLNFIIMNRFDIAQRSYPHCFTLDDMSKQAQAPQNTYRQNQVKQLCLYVTGIFLQSHNGPSLKPEPPMKMHFDHLRETVLILDKDLSLLDIFEVIGATERELPPGSCFITYKCHLIQEGLCILCGVDKDHIGQSCVSNSGNHAIVGRNLTNIPLLHQATSYDIPLHEIRFDEFVFYVENDNLFKVANTHGDNTTSMEV
ncbi:MAG: hypothetical protein CR997_07640 [Acidobacteria bacterium]|nr:MAG: hypothetical protein CR997_07640 [Acidobacteriota bacterium]